MRPIVIRQGDHLSLLAHRFNFDATEVWNHPANAELRRTRKNPEILCPGDILQIPDPESPEWFTVRVGAVNHFVATVPTVKVQLALSRGGNALQSEPFTVSAGSYRSAGTTTSQGMASFEVPLGVQNCLLTMTRTGRTYRLLVGHMDPIEQPSGAWKRLAQLGYLAAPRELLPEPAALASLKRFQKDSGLPESGELDPDTLRALEAAHGS
jgi:hypothetical protein